MTKSDVVITKGYNCHAMENNKEGSKAPGPMSVVSDTNIQTSGESHI